MPRKLPRANKFYSARLICSFIKNNLLSDCAMFILEYFFVNKREEDILVRINDCAARYSLNI